MKIECPNSKLLKNLIIIRLSRIESNYIDKIKKTCQLKENIHNKAQDHYLPKKCQFCMFKQLNHLNRLYMLWHYWDKF